MCAAVILVKGDVLFCKGIRLNCINGVSVMCIIFYSNFIDITLIAIDVFVCSQGCPFRYVTFIV